MINKKLLCIALSVSMVASLFAGCGTVNTESTSIELVEPVGVSENYAFAEKRDLINYEILHGKIVPKTYELSFASNQSFKKYGSLPGTEVKAGDSIAIASTDSIDEQIKNKKEQIKNTQENYEDTIEELQENLSKEKGDVDNLKQIVSNFENMTEDEKKTYPNYESEYRKYLGYYQSTVANIERYEEQITEKTETYNLDINYYNKELNRLNEDRNDILATAPIDGTVVAVNYYEEGNWVSKDEIVGAVGDFSTLRLKTDFIYENDLKRAEEYYAFINGKRYEAEYIKDESEVGSSPSESYSAFNVIDPNNEIKVGDYGVIVVIKATRKDVLAIPNEALNSDSDGNYVYIYENGGTTRMTVSIGIKSGYYTEITAGLSEGDKIVSEFKIDSKATKEEKLTSGNVSASFSETGYLFYSKIERITNPVEYGTTYLNKITVNLYERVTKGQVVAEITVAADDITIRRKERTLLRANEDLNDLLSGDTEKNKRMIKNQREYIADLTEEISKMKANSSLTQLVAPFDGIITGLINYEEGDIINYNSTVVTISDENNCFITVEDNNGQLTYGNKVNVEYEGEGGKKANAEGTVVTVAPCGLSSKLKTGFSLIRVSPEDLAKMASSNRSFDGWWRRSNFKVTASIRSMENVVLVPKRAVKTENGVSYVIVKDENGNYAYKSFVAGGSDTSNYWVSEGLTEGTTICLE